MEIDTRQLSETYPIADQYADGVGKIEVTGSNVRMVLFTNRERDEGEIDREIVGRVVMPIEAIIRAVQMILSTPRLLKHASALTDLLGSVKRDGKVH